MKRLILRVMDWDVTWVGLGWLRPQPRDPLSGQAALVIVGITSLWALAAGPLAYAMLILAGIGSREAAIIGAICTVAAVALNAFLQLISGVLWNERAAELRAVGLHSEPGAPTDRWSL